MTVGNAVGEVVGGPGNPIKLGENKDEFIRNDSVYIIIVILYYP